MRWTIILLLFLFLVMGCKTKPINQKINKQTEGLWIEQYTQDNANYKSIGKFHKGEPVKKWRHYLNGKVIKREKYKNNICITTFYHKNGKVQSKGKTKLETSEKNIHWFYFGHWTFFDEAGKRIMIKKYEDGNLISEIKIK